MSPVVVPALVPALAPALAPAVALADALVRRTRGGYLSVLFERPTGADAYDAATDTRDAGAPPQWMGIGVWLSGGGVSSSIVAGLEGATRSTERRTLLITGASLTAPVGTPPGTAPLVPVAGDTVVADGRSYGVTNVAPRGDVGGGLAPLYHVEVGI